MIRLSSFLQEEENHLITARLTMDLNCYSENVPRRKRFSWAGSIGPLLGQFLRPLLLDLSGQFDISLFDQYNSLFDQYPSEQFDYFSVPKRIHYLISLKLYSHTNVIVGLISFGSSGCCCTFTMIMKLSQCILCKKKKSISFWKRWINNTTKTWRLGLYLL